MPEKLSLAVLLTCSLYLSYRSATPPAPFSRPAVIESAVPSVSVPSSLAVDSRFDPEVLIQRENDRVNPKAYGY